jgi:hypothetical protein
LFWQAHRHCREHSELGFWGLGFSILGRTGILCMSWDGLTVLAGTTAIEGMGSMSSNEAIISCAVHEPQYTTSVCE